ncbi:hypothetical protein EVAR_86236_1 [Eumeta japonica]|uniref:Uncharacterized protein n=1 Tax=Eumeta variegata TaxID=151549 RepID=A0A4C1UBZ0_EUMVA|nr:hypothetical protein EVAR_86236_1 [Eumeta japonica]
MTKTSRPYSGVNYEHTGTAISFCPRLTVIWCVLRGVTFDNDSSYTFADSLLLRGLISDPIESRAAVLAMIKKKFLLQRFPLSLEPKTLTFGSDPSRAVDSRALIGTSHSVKFRPPRGHCTFYARTPIL